MDDAMNDRGDFAKKPEPTPQRKTTPISYNDVAQKQKDMDAAYKPAAGKAVQYGVGAATEAAKMIGRGVGAAASGVSSSVDEMFTGSQKSKDKFKKSRLARI